MTKGALDVSGDSPQITPIETAASMSLTFANTATTDAWETVRAYLAVSPVDFTDKIVTAILYTSLGKYEAPVQSRAVNQGKAAILHFDGDFISAYNPDVIYIEDEIFKQYLVDNYDNDGDGEISITEAELITEINLSIHSHGINSHKEYGEISSLVGIEHMPALKSLYFHDTSVWSVDLTGNPDLRILECYNCYLGGLNTSNNPNLTAIRCGNNDITSLDLSGNPKLTWLSCGSNKLKTLDLSGNPELSILGCSNNRIKDLNLTNNLLLNDLDCSSNCLTALNLPQDMEINSIRQIICSDNLISSFILPQGEDLIIERFDCSDNSLSDIKVNNVKGLLCFDNPINNIDVTEDPYLEWLTCRSTNVTAVDLTKNPLLNTLNCGETPIEELDLSCNPLISQLRCDGCKLKSLDLTNNPEISYLYCDNNRITQLDLSNNTKLYCLNCENNQLALLDISNTNAGIVCCNPMKDSNGLNTLKTIIVTKTQYSNCYFMYDLPEGT